MDLSVTSVQCMSTVWSADHFAAFIFCTFDPNRLVLFCKSDCRDSVPFTSPGNLNSHENIIFRPYEMLAYNLLTFKRCILAKLSVLALCL